MSLTGVQRGQGWRPVGVPPGEFPRVVRFIGLQAQTEEFIHIGSGVIIGAVGERYLIVASAAHVFADNEKPLGLPPHPDDLPGFPRENFRYTQAALARLLCGIPMVNGGGREIFCRIASAETSRNPALRDTALLFVELPAPMPQLGRMPVNLGHPPAPNETILVGGVAESSRAETLFRSDGTTTAAAPIRALVVREGFFAGYEVAAGRLQYQVYHHLIPVDAGMSGGPVIHIRPAESPIIGAPVRAVWCVVAINNLSDKVEKLETHVEVNSYATLMLAFWSHEVQLLPTREWISFGEAVRRGIIYTHGPEVQRVIEEVTPQGKRWHLPSILVPWF